MRTSVFRSEGKPFADVESGSSECKCWRPLNKSHPRCTSTT